jgi:protein TonB
MAKNRPTHVSRPVYPGGITAMKQFVATNLIYPEAAKEAKVEGTVTVRYTLNYTGKVTDVKIKTGLGHGCDEEAIRVVKLMRFTVPQSSKKKVRIHQNLNIHFKLPKAKKVAKPANQPAAPGAGPLTINYTATEGAIGGRLSRPVSPGKEAKEAGSYSYTIEW